MRRKLLTTSALLGLVGASNGGCGEAWVNLTASFGGRTAGQRGEFGVLFINNTPFRAVGTLGSYDQTDPQSQPDFVQFDLNDRGPVLDGNSTSNILPFSCARVFSIGGPRLFGLIHANLPNDDFSEEAEVAGIEFFGADPDAPESLPVSQGLAASFEALLGVDFPCNSLLVLRLEINDAGSDPFRVDFELIPSRSER